MYNLSNRLPAPYELNQIPAIPQMSPQLTQFTQNNSQPPMMLARGGRAKNKKMVIAHMSPHELNILDHLQGDREHCPKTGIRSYMHLEEILKNPHIAGNIHRHAHAQHRASGGLMGPIEHLREGGRNGDTELAMIGPHTHHIFNQLSDGPTLNPTTGLPEYWSLGNALSGIWDTIKGAGSKLLPHAKDLARTVLPQILPTAQKALGDKFGDIGNTIGSALPGLTNSALGPQTGPINPMTQALGQGINKGIQGYQGGQSARQAFGQGLQSAGQQYGGGIGSALENTGSSLSQGKGIGQSLRSGAESGFKQMGGMDQLGNMARNTMGAYGRGGLDAARQAATGQLSKYGQRAMMPQYPKSEDHEDMGDYGRQMFNEG